MDLIVFCTQLFTMFSCTIVACNVSHLEALDAGQVVELLGRLHVDAAVLPLQVQLSVSGRLSVQKHLSSHGGRGAGGRGAEVRRHVFGCHVGVTGVSTIVDPRRNASSLLPAGLHLLVDVRAEVEQTFLGWRRRERR